MILYELLTIYEGCRSGHIEVYYDFIKIGNDEGYFSGQIRDIPYRLLEEEVEAWWYEEDTLYIEVKD